MVRRRQGLVNVLIKHHPTIGDIISEKILLHVMFKIPKKRHLPNPQTSYIFSPKKRAPPPSPHISLEWWFISKGSAHEPLKRILNVSESSLWLIPCLRLIDETQAPLSHDHRPDFQVFQERTSLMRFLVQREIARGEGKSGLSPKYLLALHASSIYVSWHARVVLKYLQFSMERVQNIWQRSVAARRTIIVGGPSSAEEWVHPGFSKDRVYMGHGIPVYAKSTSSS